MDTVGAHTPQDYGFVALIAELSALYLQVTVFAYAFGSSYGSGRLHARRICRLIDIGRGFIVRLFYAPGNESAGLSAGQ